MLEIAAQSLSTSAIEPEPVVRLADITNPDKANALFRNRRSAGAIASSKFDAGDHYQNAAGYIGAKPLAGTPGSAQTMQQIKDGFVSENVIKEVDDRHIAGLLGREPLWGFLPSDAPSPTAEKRRKLFSKLYQLVTNVVRKASTGSLDKLSQEADEALTVAWWNTRKVRKALKRAVRTALLEERCVVHIFFPAGLRDTNGNIPDQRDLSAALTIRLAGFVFGCIL